MGSVGTIRRKARPGGRAFVAVLLWMVTIVTACGDGDSDDSKKVTQVLNAALQAHVEGRIAEAEEGYRNVLELDKDNKFAMYNLGVIDQGAGRLDAAEAEYRKAIAVDANYAPAIFNLAVLRADRGDAAEAIALYRKAIAVRPDGADAHLNLGLLLRQQGALADAEAEIRKAIELNPEIAKNPAVSTSTTRAPSTTTTKSR